MTGSRMVRLLLLLAVTASATTYAREIRPIGPEFVVLEPGAFGGAYGYASATGVAGDELGNFVIVFGASDSEIRGIRVSAANAVGAPFELVSNSDGYDYAGRIAMRPSGEFVVTWMSSPTTCCEGLVRPVARRFDPSGVPLGDVSSITDPAHAGTPDVGMDAAGAFVVVWGDFTSDRGGVRALRFDPSGSSVGGAFQVNADEAGEQIEPSIAVDGTGGFVVAWTDYSGTATEYDTHIEARRFDATPAATGSEFQVNEVTGLVANAEVGADAAGNFVVSWISHYAGDTDPYGSAAAVRRFNATPAPVTGERRLARDVRFNLQDGSPRIAVDPGGEFLVVWANVDHWDTLFARASTGAIFKANSASDGTMHTPAIATGGSGDFLIVWTNGRGLVARRFGPPRTTTKLRLKDDADPSRRKLTIKAAGGVTSSRLGTRIDPPSDGAFLQIYNASGAGADAACMALPAAHWTAKGTESGGATRFVYRDPDFADGPCANITVVDRKIVKAACQGKLHPLGFSLDEPQQGSIAVRLVTGEHAYCSVFGPDAPIDEPGRFAAANTAPPGACPPAPASCP